MSDATNKRPAGPAMGFGPGRGPMRGKVEKAKDVKGTMKKLVKYFKPYLAGLSIALGLTIAATVLSIFIPKIMGNALTVVFEGIMKRMMALKMGQSPAGITIDFGKVKDALVLLGALAIISAFFNYIQQFVMAGISQRLVQRMRNDVRVKLSRLPLKYFDGTSHGDIMSRVSNDIDTIGSTMQQGLVQIFSSVITVIGVLIMMFTINVPLTLIALATLPLSILVTVFVAKKSQKHFSSQQKSLGMLNGQIEEVFGGHIAVKTYQRENDEIKKFKKTNEELYKAAWKAQFISGVIMPVMMFIGNLGYILVTIVGGIMVTKRTVTIGDVQAFIQYIRQFTQPINQIANIVNLIQSTIAAAERVFEIIAVAEEDPEEKAMTSLPPVKGSIGFNDISFRYLADKPLIENLDIQVKQGQTIAIVGPTSAGKTTLVNLLMRFYEIQGGTITIDGIDTKLIKRNVVRNLFGMVLQDTWLFNGTIKDNIRYGKPDATTEEITLAAKNANAHHFIMALPDGYDTVINEEASNISQGEKQLITIARAFLANPQFLILDEATSNVDTLTEVYIQNAMHDLMQGRTSFIIAHRLSTIRKADKILVMNNGSIIEQGTHDELIQANGFYADLYKSQFLMPMVS